MPKHKFHTYSRSEDICGVLLTDLDYPEQTAQSILSKITNEFVAKYPKSAYSDPKRVKAADPAPLPFPELKEYIVKYQDPHQADPLLKIQSELNETKTILHHTIEDMLERGEKIDNLVAKSDVLSSQSKMFYTQAKKQNSCCSVM
jgi:synaptobrevin family protein YKT6